MPLKFVLSWDRYISHVGDPAMQILASNSFRWLEVHFPSDDTAPNPGVMVRIKGRLPLLRCLEIGTELGRQDLFEDAPALISIGGTPDPDWQLPYDQLTKLNLNYCQGDVAIPILQRCTNVQHAELDNIIDWEGQDRVTMPNMRSMVITASNDEEVIFTCNQLRLPQLDFLVLQNDVYVTREPPLDEAGYDILIERFFTDCSCITTFKMKGLRVSDLQLIRILACLPQLRKLSIRNLVWYVPNAQSYSLQPSNRTISSQFIQRLTVKQDAEELVIVPKLTELTLASLPRDFDARSFVDMIFSRWRPRNGGPATFDDDCLCTVKVGLKFKDDSDVAQEFSRLEPLQRLGFGFNAYEKI
ncbi:hypothetical protein VNI00_003436 [Paramarasmius palmivorus]|uniref:Uncharacterized protein n=1 Tax=Paramarasmius palmivorus TaxID=297713 RepID=A0AAW0DQE2_9AGAR